ncbi:hypothetical protein, partial [Acinetobacter bereziniae]|uniref:hypothetical protein n=1 Tax=Acinetobacter bereziniae TaxID=106648 RepID=UPI001C2E9C2B
FSLHTKLKVKELIVIISSVLFSILTIMLPQNDILICQKLRAISFHWRRLKELKSKPIASVP